MNNAMDLPKRIIMCIDARSFFATVTCLMNGFDPRLTKLAVVSNKEQQGSVVLSATSLLKKVHGIQTGRRLFEIPQEANIHVMNPSMSTYIRVSNHITSILLRYVAPEDLHTYSIDEAFIDCTASLHLFAKDATQLALIIQRAVFAETGVDVTFGIGPNPLMAKLALDFEGKKALSGIASWDYEDLPQKLWPMRSLKKMWGIGERTEVKLKRLGVYTIGAIAVYPLSSLIQHFGKEKGTMLHEHANGIDFSRISETYRAVQPSIHKSQILPHAYERVEDLKILLLEQIEELCFRLRKQRKCVRTIQLTVVYHHTYSEKGFSKQQTLSFDTNLTLEVYEGFLTLFNRYYKGGPVKKLGTALTQLVDDDERQMHLFCDEEKRENQIKLAHAMDDIRGRFGKNSLLWAVSYMPHATGRSRNEKISGHQS